MGEGRDRGFEGNAVWTVPFGLITAREVSAALLSRSRDNPIFSILALFSSRSSAIVELPAIMTGSLPVPGRDLFPAEISRGVCPLCTYIRVVLFACIIRGANDARLSFENTTGAFS